MKTVIIAMSGRAQSGKTTLLNFMHGHEMKRHDIIDKFTISPEGNLVVNCTFEDENGVAFEEMGVLDLFQDTEMFYEYASRNIWPFIKAYNFADSLKELCVSLFDIPYECVYGTNEQKNTIVPHLLWENMPGVICWPNYVDCCGNADYSHIEPEEIGLLVHKSGPMTAREFMQFLGTDVMRRMYEPVWVNNCLKRIHNDAPPIAVIGDCRFINEVLAVKNAGGKVVRLTRNTTNGDHKSETDVNNYKDFDVVIENSDISIEESCNLLLDFLEKEGVTKRIKKHGKFTTTAR